jgi:hypothetical protein
MTSLRARRAGLRFREGYQGTLVGVARFPAGTPARGRVVRPLSRSVARGTAQAPLSTQNGHSCCPTASAAVAPLRSLPGSQPTVNPNRVVRVHPGVVRLPSIKERLHLVGEELDGLKRLC